MWLVRWILPSLFPHLNLPWKSLSTHGWIHANNHRTAYFQQISAVSLRTKSQIWNLFRLFFERVFYTTKPEILWFSFLGALHARKALKYWIYPPLHNWLWGFAFNSVTHFLSKWIHKLVTLLLSHNSESRENLNCRITNEFHSFYVYRNDQWMDKKNIHRRQGGNVNWMKIVNSMHKNEIAVQSLIEF